jgi:hypothetical protein
MDFPKEEEQVYFLQEALMKASVDEDELDDVREKNCYCCDELTHGSQIEQNEESKEQIVQQWGPRGILDDGSSDAIAVGEHAESSGEKDDDVVDWTSSKVEVNQPRDVLT